MKTRHLLGALAFSVILSQSSAAPHFGGPLNFETRVAAQRAIERVYYSHQLEASRSFDEAVPEAVIQEKVRRTLRLSVALEKFWNTPITPDMLRKEAERIARDTRLPGRLAEMYAALGD